MVRRKPQALVQSRPELATNREPSSTGAWPELTPTLECRLYPHAVYNRVNQEQKGAPSVKNDRQITQLLIAIPCAIAVVFTTLFLSILPFNRALAAKRDYIVYWATGQQLAHHANPYDGAALSRLEQAAGFKGPESFYMRNTPWSLPLALPFGYFGAQAAALPWSLLLLGLLFASVRMLRNLFGSAGGYLDWLGYCFPPALFCIILGQTSIFLLLGLTLFLRLHKTHPFAAGAALWFCSLKPHLFLPFGIVLLVWIVLSRSYRILSGGIAGMAAGAIVTACIDPDFMAQYAYYMRTSAVTREFTPCLGDLLRDWINPAAEWIAFMPGLLGCIWALAYFWPRRHTWDWFENGSLVMLVSIFVAPFGWVFDQSLAIPAVLFAVSRNTSRRMLSILALIYMLIEIEIVSPFGLHSPAYLWTAPAWLIWYLFARASANRAAASRLPAVENI